MSKLIREHEDNAAEVVSSAPILSSSAIVDLLKGCQGLARDHVERAFDVFLKSLFDAYDIEIDKAKSNDESVKLMAMQRSIRKNATELKHQFCGHFLEGFVRFSKKTLNTSIGSGESDEGGKLSIIENEELEESIAISSITQRVDTYFSEPLWALNQRFSVLNGGVPVTEANNPASPIQYCDALRSCLDLLELSASAKLLAYKVFDLQLLNLFKLVSEDINSYLGQQGVLSNIKYSLPKEAAPKSYLAEEGDTFGRRQEDYGIQRAEPNPEASPEQYQAELVSAIRSLNQQLKAGVVSAASVASGPAYTVPQLVQALGGLQVQPQALLNLENAEPGSLVPLNVGAAASDVQHSLSDAGEAGSVKQSDMETIDLVGMVFEYMLNDENIPDAVKTLLSYLHTPFLKIAFIDHDFFESTEHPARVLLNTLADAGSKWVQNNGSSQFDMYDQIRGTVDRVLKEFDKDVKVITTLLFEFNSYAKKAQRKQELTEKRAKEKAEGEDKLREVKLRVNVHIRKYINGHELPSAILLLLLQPWSDYLAFILLRHGSESQSWKDATRVVEAILWCVQPKKDPTLVGRQVKNTAKVIEALRQGFEVIGYDSAKAEKLIVAFSNMSKLAMKAKKAEPAPEPMREEMVRKSAEKAGDNAGAEEGMSPEEAQMVESLKMIEFGTWFEFEDGKRLKVAWYNGRTSHYMFVDQMGKRVNMESGLVLARKMIQGSVKVISGSSKPFFERALENIYHKLQEQAGDSAGAETAKAE
ncbi:DUF1631 family protein [Agaribacterium sp. ZY112]|uniref:DUF1631 family protein n=1 Tax=Agaribacterium sp. ZY112 TaxID=3233574 RepID=UPI003526B3B5